MAGRSVLEDMYILTPNFMAHETADPIEHVPHPDSADQPMAASPVDDMRKDVADKIPATGTDDEMTS